jgi:hypothetical protein
LDPFHLQRLLAHEQGCQPGIRVSGLAVTASQFLMAMSP